MKILKPIIIILAIISIVICVCVIIGSTIELYTYVSTPTPHEKQIITYKDVLQTFVKGAFYGVVTSFVLYALVLVVRLAWRIFGYLLGKR